MYAKPKCLCGDYSLSFDDMVVGKCPYGLDLKCIECSNYRPDPNYYLHKGFVDDLIDDSICRTLFLIKIRSELCSDDVPICEI